MMDVAPMPVLLLCRITPRAAAGHTGCWHETRQLESPYVVQESVPAAAGEESAAPACSTFRKPDIAKTVARASSLLGAI